MRMATFISACYYFVISVGVSVSLHFCKGELTCFSLLSESSLCCHANNEHADTENHTVCTDGCCSTEKLIITLDADYTFESADFPNNEFSPLSEGIHLPILVDTQTMTSDAPTRGSPPSLPLFLLYSSFIFYG